MRKGELHWPDVKQRLRRRRLEHARFSRKPLRKTVGIKLPETARNHELSPEGKAILQGQSASPGTCEGIARVILNPGIDAELQPGEILVAPYTDPPWTPLFLTAGAAVVEVGSYLSHAGTVAREYGLPCVVDVAECTKRIQSGDRLYVDGAIRESCRFLSFDKRPECCSGLIYSAPSGRSPLKNPERVQYVQLGGTTPSMVTRCCLSEK